MISTETGENGPETVRTHLIENKVVDGVLFTFKKETTDKDNKVVSKSEMTEITSANRRSNRYRKYGIGS